MWLLFSFGSAIFAGITAILAKIGIKDTDSNLATAIRTIVILVFSWLMVWIVGSQNTMMDISTRTLIFLILSGFATGASWLCYFRALQLGDVNKVTPIDKSSTVLSIVFAFVLLNEQVNWNKIVGLILIGIGTYFMITKKDGILISSGEVETQERSNSWIVYAMLSALFASLTSILGKIGIQGVESNLGTAIRTIVVFVMAWIIVFITKKGKEIKFIDKRSWIFLGLSGITTGISWLCYYKALQDGPASVVVPIDKMSIVITVAFSYFILKESISKKSIVGLALIVTGTLALLY